MSLENAQYLHQLNASNPSGADRLKEGDDHIRMLKAALLATFPGIQGPLDASVTHTLLNSLAARLIPIGSIIMWTGPSGAVPAGWAICDGRQVTSSDGTRTFNTPNMVDRVPTGANAPGGRPIDTLWGAYTATVGTEVGGFHSHTAGTGAAGSHDHGSRVAGTVLTTAQLPAHSHYTFANVAGGYASLPGLPEGAANREANGSSSGASYSIGGSNAEATIGRTSSVGSGASHDHGINADGTHTHAVGIDGNGAHNHAVTVPITQPAYSVYFLMKI